MKPEMSYRTIRKKGIVMYHRAEGECAAGCNLRASKIIKTATDYLLAIF
jgi:hypothetical protein